MNLTVEHAGLSEVGELLELIGAVSAADTGGVRRVPVGPGMVGRSLRALDYRRAHGGEVLAIQTAEGGVSYPPDPARSLRAGDVLLVVDAPDAEEN